MPALQTPPGHIVPCGCTLSAGHWAEAPLQVSGTSQVFTVARHTTPPSTNRSLGHVALEPVQRSGGSHRPTLARHTADDARKPSLGHVPPSPGQNSGASQPPLDAGRQEKLDGRTTSGGQSPRVPGQVSATSQLFAAARQIVVFDFAPHMPLMSHCSHPRLHGALQQRLLAQNRESH